jgi:predicted TPR repeat methyltransferase
MPTSHPILLTPVLTRILHMQPKTVLDIGIGCGKWGSLIREYTDIWYRRWDRETWQTRIEGIEIFPQYRTPNWEWYDKIHLGDATSLIKLSEPFDLILCIEVLEHMEKDTGKTFINDALQKCKRLLISFTNSHQDAAFGNPHEQHVSSWHFNDFVQIAESTCLLSVNNGNKQLIEMKGKL